MSSWGGIVFAEQELGKNGDRLSKFRDLFHDLDQLKTWRSVRDRLFHEYKEGILSGTKSTESKWSTKTLDFLNSPRLNGLVHGVYWMMNVEPHDDIVGVVSIGNETHCLNPSDKLIRPLLNDMAFVYGVIRSGCHESLQFLLDRGLELDAFDWAQIHAVASCSREMVNLIPRRNFVALKLMLSEIRSPKQAKFLVSLNVLNNWEMGVIARLAPGDYDLPIEVWEQLQIGTLGYMSEQGLHDHFITAFSNELVDLLDALLAITRLQSAKARLIMIDTISQLKQSEVCIKRVLDAGVFPFEDLARIQPNTVACVRLLCAAGVPFTTKDILESIRRQKLKVAKSFLRHVKQIVPSMAQNVDDDPFQTALFFKDVNLIKSLHKRGFIPHPQTRQKLLKFRPIAKLFALS